MIYTNMFRKLNKKFDDRYDAGNSLADELMKYKDENAVILALPRGGVPLGFQVARSLKAPLSVLVSRKVGAPGHEEFGIGAIAEEDTLYLDEDTIDSMRIDTDAITKTIDKEKAELRRRVEVYRDNQSIPSLKNKTVILVDDGLATGGTAKAAIEALKKLEAGKIVFAVPVCAKQSANEIVELVDEMICLHSPRNLRAIGLYYDDFGQTTDEEVVRLLQKADEIEYESN